MSHPALPDPAAVQRGHSRLIRAIAECNLSQPERAALAEALGIWTSPMNKVRTGTASLPVLSGFLASFSLLGHACAGGAGGARGTSRG